MATTRLRFSGDVVHKAHVVGRSLAVLRRSGMLRGVAEAFRSAVAVRKFGPFAGVLEIGAQRDSAAVALVDELGPLTFGELNWRANALARDWAAQGFGSGTVIAALCRDHRHLLTVMAASGKTGAKLLLLNTGFGKPQLADVVRREGVRVLIFDEEFSALLDAVDPTIERYVAWRDETADPADETVASLDEVITLSDGGSVASPERPGGFVLLTSGTTGIPKGAPRDKASPLASAQFLDRIPLRSDGGATFVASPIFHATGMGAAALTMALGSTLVVRRRFDPEETLRAVEQYKCTALVLVPTMLQRIMDLDSVVLRKYDTSSLRIILSAGSALAPALCGRVMDTFGDILHNLYGSTECATVAVATPADLRVAPGAAGRPPVGCSVELYDKRDQQITTPGEIGRIFARSALSFQGYTDGTSKPVLNGLLATGDVGHFDANGLLFVDGRDDDMIISGGENVYPIEVENLIADRSDVREAAVIGVPDGEFGERLKAFVVLANGADTDASEIQEHVKKNLARYKTPREVEFVDELPRNATGKLVRAKLRDRS